MLGMLIAAVAATEIAESVSANIAGAIKDSNIRFPRRSASNSDYISVGQSSEEFVGSNYRQTINALLGRGFTNISTQEIRQYKNNIFNRDAYGRVVSVTINGTKSFNRRTTFPKDAYVLVSFHVFRDSPPAIIPELNNSQYSEPNRSSDSYSYRNANVDEELFCEYCDCRVDKSWALCKYCGAPIGRSHRQSSF